MTACRLILLSGFIAWSATTAATAQETRVHIVQSGADNLVSDLKDIVGLTPNKALQKEWKNLSETLDGFLMGLDRSKPIRIDYFIGKDATGNSSLTYEPSFPIADFTGKNGFLANLKSFGYNVKKVAKADGDLYEVTEQGKKNAKPMYMRYLKPYVVFADDAKSLPAKMPDPTAAVAGLLKGGHDVALEFSGDAAGAKGRLAEFQSLRKELEAAIKFKRNEDQAEFDLRKLTATQFFDEVERFLVESQTIFAGWTTQPGAMQGIGVFKHVALPGTSLLQGLQLLASKPSYFANVTLHPNEVLAGRLTFPLDKMRKDHALARHKVLRKATDVSIDKRENLSAEGKQASKEAFSKLVDIFDATVGEDKALDGFVDVHADGKGKNIAVAGLRAAKTNLVPEIIELLPKVRNLWQVKLKVEEHEGVAIHQITIPKDYAEEFQSLFGDDMTLWIGVGEEAVWSAAGPGSLDELKAAITQQKKPLPAKADPVFGQIAVKFGPWVKVIDVIEKNLPQPEKPTKQQQQQKKERDRIRQLALEAFEPGTDLLTGKLTRNGDEVDGELTINDAVFRFIGSAIADFSKTNLH